MLHCSASLRDTAAIKVSSEVQFQTVKMEVGNGLCALGAK